MTARIEEGQGMAEEWIAEQFEAHRDHLRGVAYRMLGSVTEAEDAVQEAWLRLDRSDAETVDNLGGWLTTVTARICLNVLRSRGTRREESLEDRLERLPEPVVTWPGGGDPQQEALLADAVGTALLVVLDRLSPPERLAFVLHDMFAVPFEAIAPVLGRSHEATRQLASRARRRVQGDAPIPDADVRRQREVVDAFFAAAHEGDLDRLMRTLDPDVVLHADFGAGRGTKVQRGAAAVAGNALMYANADRIVRPVLVNGAAGVAIEQGGALFSVMAFTVVDGRVAQIEAFGDPTVLARVEAAR